MATTSTTSWAPQRKVWTGGVGGAAATVLLWGISLTGVDVPTGVAAAVTVLVTAGVAYLVPNQSEPPPAS